MFKNFNHERQTEEELAAFHGLNERFGHGIIFMSTTSGNKTPGLFDQPRVCPADRRSDTYSAGRRRKDGLYMHKAIFRSFTLLLITALAVLLVTACGRTASETPVSPSNGETAFYETNTTSIEMTEAITGESMEGEETSAETQETGAAVYQVPPSDEKGGEISVSAPSNKTTTATDKTTAQTTKKTTTQTSKTPEITAPLPARPPPQPHRLRSARPVISRKCFVW